MPSSLVLSFLNVKAELDAFLTGLERQLREQHQACYLSLVPKTYNDKRREPTPTDCLLSVSAPHKVHTLIINQLINLKKDLVKNIFQACKIRNFSLTDQFLQPLTTFTTLSLLYKEASDHIQQKYKISLENNQKRR